jgi:hypothetical protein
MMTSSGMPMEPNIGIAPAGVHRHYGWWLVAGGYPELAVTTDHQPPTTNQSKYLMGL